MRVDQVIKEYWEGCLRSSTFLRSSSWITRKIRCHEGRGAKVIRVTADGAPYQKLTTPNGEQQIDYALHVTFFIKQGKHFYIEEAQRDHRAIIKNGTSLERDDEIRPEGIQKFEREPLVLWDEEDPSQFDTPRFTYDRQQAVQYANRWWNSYNPAYRQFTDDCTNFISQCLREGGAPTWGSPNRGKGWWYNYKVWSYSWTVANAMRWYLSGSKQGLRGKEMERARDLILGDVICYDFEGDGRWNHTTIVVDKDAFGEPLVNAHTSNSYHRYWDYEDSTAYTPNIQYKFFRIGE